MRLELSASAWRSLRFSVEMELLTIHDNADREQALNRIMRHFLDAGLDRLQTAQKLLIEEAAFDRSKPARAPSWAFSGAHTPQYQPRATCALR